MTKELLGAVSALALLAGVATAQDAGTTATPAPATPPAAGPAEPMMAPDPAAGAATSAEAPAESPAAMETQQAESPAPAAEPPAAMDTQQAESPAPAAEPPAAMDTQQAESPAPAAEPPAAMDTQQAESPAPAAEPPAAMDTQQAESPAPATGTTTTAVTAGSGTEVSADDMMGRQVQGSDGESIGRVADVIVDPESGQIQRLVISSGGFLGLGAKTVALDFSEVEVRPEGGIVASNVTQQDVEGMPEYDVRAETAPLDQPPPVATTTDPIAGGGMGAGGAVAPAPGTPAQ